MGMFQKVGDWFSDKSDRFARRGTEEQGSYYASDEAEQAYGRMQGAAEEYFDSQEMGNEVADNSGIDPFHRVGKDYGGRVPYQSKRDAAEQQARAYGAANQPRQEYNQPAAYSAQPEYGQAQMGYIPPKQPEAMPQTAAQSNVVPFPGMFRAPDGGTYAHMEYIVLLRSRNECIKVIEYIKTNASVFLSMEFIANDSERQRCVDMLSGAAYTLGCALNRISPRGVYLISSASVYVVIDPAMEKFTNASEMGTFARRSQEGYGGRQPSAGYQQQPQQGYPQQQAVSYAAAPQQQSQAYYAPQHTEKRAPVTFGNVMAGNVTASFQPARPAENEGMSKQANHLYTR